MLLYEATIRDRRPKMFRLIYYWTHAKVSLFLNDSIVMCVCVAMCNSSMECYFRICFSSFNLDNWYCCFWYLVCRDGDDTFEVINMHAMYGLHWHWPKLCCESSVWNNNFNWIQLVWLTKVILIAGARKCLVCLMYVWLSDCKNIDPAFLLWVERTSFEHQPNDIPST